MARPQVPKAESSRIARSLALSCALFTLACDADEDDNANAVTEAFADSLATWDELSASNDESYRYSVESTIEEVFGEPECVLSTTFTVIEGEIVSRETSGTVLEFGACPEPWIEEGEEVGQHSGAGIAEPQTLDDLYALCEADVIGSAYPFEQGDPDESEPFSVDDQGIMRRCGWSYWDSTHHQVKSSPYIVIAEFEWL